MTEDESRNAAEGKSGGGLARLRAGAARDDYASTARLARALYAAGLGPREVVRDCYDGVGFPEEFFVLADAGPVSLDLMVRFTGVPWRLAVPPDRGGVPERPDPAADTVRRVFARDPDLVPLFVAVNNDVRHGGRVHCYRLTELRAGRTSVFGVGEAVEAHTGIERSGDSLLGVLEEHHTRYADWLEEQMRDPDSIRSDAIDEELVAEIRESAEVVARLRRTAEERGGA